jgi:hypothetical protein
MSDKNSNRTEKERVENTLQDLIRKKSEENRILKKLLDQLSGKKPDMKKEIGNDD